MITKEAKQIAVEWVEANADSFPGFAGAFFHGSVNVTEDAAPWPASSDVDISILAKVPRGLSTVHHRGLLLEVSAQPIEGFDLSPEAILSDFEHAIHFSLPSIIKDPIGRLHKVHEIVRVEYARRKWVIKRCQGAEKRVTAVVDGFLRRFGYGEDTAWGAVFTLYYATLVAAQILALADLRNPTLRKGFVVSRQILEGCDRLDLQESLLGALGAATLTPDQVDRHVKEFRRALETASSVIRNPFFLSDKLKAESRSYAVQGVQEMIDMGQYRESVFWIHILRAVAQRAIDSDAPRQDRERFQQAYLELRDDLGLRVTEQVATHQQQVRRLLPQIMEVAEEVMRQNPAIRD